VRYLYEKQSMKSDVQRLREAVRSYVRKILKENDKADIKWAVDKVATALDAAASKKKDYQLAAAHDSDLFKQLAQDIRDGEQSDHSPEDQQLMETFFDWLARGAQKYVHGIIDRRAGYLKQAVASDPKLAQMAKNSGMSPGDFENRVYTLMKSDKKFLQALATQRYIRR
jgi:DNA-binding phage protein